jgi:glycosyltransferase involved in cell wall biosynthesis
MRLLYVHERFGALAGAEANVFITASELKKLGHAVAILHGSSTGKSEENWKAIFDTRFPFDANNGREAAEQALTEFKPDAVFIHKTTDLNAIDALVHSEVPLVRMVHDHDIYCMKSYKYAYFSRNICTRSFSPYCVFPCGAFVARNRDGKFPLKYVSYADKKREIALNRKFQRMVVVTEYMKQELLRNGFDESRIEIHPPIPRMAGLDHHSSFSDRNLILYVGQIIRGKGVDILLQALSKLSCRFECIILGDGNHRPACEELSRQLGLSDRVHFKGFVNQDELKRYYAECSVIAISSVWPEPIATVGLEVMRYGLPVVAFDAGGIKDWLQDGYNGFLVPWMDRTQFADRIEQLLRDKALARKMGENGRRLSSELYDFERYIRDLESMFQNRFCSIQNLLRQGCLQPADFCGLFPHKGRGTSAVFGNIPPPDCHKRPDFIGMILCLEH